MRLPRTTYEDMRYWAQRFYEAREFGGLAWAIGHDHETEVEEPIGKIMRGPLFTPSMLF